MTSTTNSTSRGNRNIRAIRRVNCTTEILAAVGTPAEVAAQQATLPVRPQIVLLFSKIKLIIKNQERKMF
jgi:hypothetical protein